MKPADVDTPVQDAKHRHRPGRRGFDDTDPKSTGRRHRSPRRWHVAVGIGAVEGIVVPFLPGIWRWVPVALAVAAVLLYATLGRHTRWETGRAILWVFAFSQALAVVVAVLAYFLSWVAYTVAAVLASVVLVMLIVDRRGRPRTSRRSRRVGPRRAAAP